ncbi:MAG TPA: gas vesicle protein [Gaiellaceae bacterium]|nr:gas vesicle protein [Gaiellaceae bacterium]
MASTADRKQSPAEAARLAREQVEELFEKPVESVSAISRGEDGWSVTLELLELPRIPDTTSVLGSYEALLDENGDLLEAKRVRRYARNQTDAQQRGGGQ